MKDGIYRCGVRQDWLDANGHMTARRFLDVFLDAGDLWLRHLGLGPTYTNGGHSIFTGDLHITFVREVPAHATLSVDSRLIDADARRLVLHQELIVNQGGFLAASAEQLFVHVDTTSRRAAPFPPERQAANERSLDREVEARRNVGRRVGLRSGAPQR
jgi:acyl-CoA thioesterase FadM